MAVNIQNIPDLESAITIPTKGARIKGLTEAQFKALADSEDAMMRSFFYGRFASELKENPLARFLPELREDLKRIQNEHNKE